MLKKNDLIQTKFNLILDEEKFNSLVKDADNGVSSAQYILGSLYKHGFFKKVDIDKAFYYLTQAANSNHEKAYTELADMYIYGLGCKRDLNKAHELLAKAHALNDIYATLLLAKLYAFESDFTHDYVKAKAYLDSVIQYADQLDYKAYALFLLSGMYELGMGVEKDHKVAFELLEQAAEYGSSKAQTNLAYKYLHAIDVKKDVDRAISLLKQASDNGYIEASYILGMLYADNTSKYADANKAYQYLIIAARQGHTDAQARVGLIGLEYVHNINQKVSYTKEQADEMILFLEDALQKDNPIALGGIGVFLLTAFSGHEESVSRAINYLNKAANMDYAPALMYMAREYELGKHISKDISKAKEFYQKALDKGFYQAKECLARLN